MTGKLWAHTNKRSLVLGFVLLALCLYGSNYIPVLLIAVGWVARSLFVLAITHPLMKIQLARLDEFEAARSDMQREVNTAKLEALQLRRALEGQELTHRMQLMALAVREQMGSRPVVPDALRMALIHQARTTGPRPQQPIAVYNMANEPRA